MNDRVDSLPVLPDRSQIAEAFVARHGWGAATRQMISGDWSGRCYIRLTDRVFDPPAQIVFMDWPCSWAEFTRFIRIRDILDEMGLHAPQIIARDLDHGFMLIEDYGDDQFGRLIDQNSPLAPALYQGAVAVLTTIYRRFEAVLTRDLPVYNADLFTEQAGLFASHYLPAVGVTGRDDFAPLLSGILQSALFDVPQTLVLRDFTPDNLMLLPGTGAHIGIDRCGLLDFQDAGLGPVGYDLVSLIEDARRDVAGIDTLALRRAYQQALPDWSDDAFDTLYAVLAAQRMIRILGVIGRQIIDHDNRDNCRLIPRLWRRLEGHLAHPVLGALKAWCDLHVPASVRYAGQESGT